MALPVGHEGPPVEDPAIRPDGHPRDFFDRFAHRYWTVVPRAIALGDILRVPDGAISIAGGLPAPELFPMETISVREQEAQQYYGPNMYQYGAPEGFRPLREAAVGYLRKLGATVESADNVLVTAGSQEAIFLIGFLFLNPGDHVAVTDPTYIGALQAFDALEAQYDVIASDEFGMIPESLDEALAKGNTKLVYVNATFSNPDANTIPEERRRRIADIMKKHPSVVFIEDDPYGRLRYEGESPPTIQALASENGEVPDNVFDMTSFSKTLCPGFRVGLTVVPKKFITPLAQLSQAMKLCGSLPNQAAVARLIENGDIEKLLPTILMMYRERRDVMIQSIEECFPQDCTFTRPEGGMFVWVTLPEGIDTTKLWELAKERGVVIVPGFPFYVDLNDPMGRRTMRLNFTNQPPENIQKAIAILGQLIAEMMGISPELRQVYPQTSAA